MASKVVAIHQPNFLPWLGYFDKIARADVFVLLDDAEFSKGSYTNRVRILVNGEPKWLTVPVDRGGGSSQPISEVRIRDHGRWREKAVETVRHSYARAEHFDEAFAVVEPLLVKEAELLAELNERAIRELGRRLAPTAELVRSSSLGAGGRATDRLIEIVAAVGGDAYLGGGGAGGYQEDEKFERAGIELVRQEFEHPDYPQAADGPVHGLSVVDALMSCGLERTAAMLGSR